MSAFALKSLTSVRCLITDADSEPFTFTDHMLVRNKEAGPEEEPCARTG